MEHTNAHQGPSNELAAHPGVGSPIMHPPHNHEGGKAANQMKANELIISTF